MRDLDSPTAQATGKRKYRVRPRPPQTKIDAQVPATMAAALDAWCAEQTTGKRFTRSYAIRRAVALLLSQREGEGQGAADDGHQKAA